MYDPLEIQSYKGKYQVNFNNDNLNFHWDEETLATSHFIIDAKVAELYKNELAPILQRADASVLLIDATEHAKSLEVFPAYVEHLVKRKLRRNQRLVAIGGGIIQDITCFLAATMLRGVEWWFYPTTLLAQADSCIGAKSSINCGNTKNILGTFTPPDRIFIHTAFLKTLDKMDIHSGIGEMLKVHAIDGVQAFDLLAKDYDNLFTDHAVMLAYIRRSLEIKKNIIEQDEFDLTVRRVMNYGHTFGHAIESATNYRIPHGIAVTIGMDMANYVAAKLEYSSADYFSRMHPVLKKNYHSFADCDIPLQEFISAISKDKKNVGKNQLGLILPNKYGKPEPMFYENNDRFQALCADYIANGRSL